MQKENSFFFSFSNESNFALQAQSYEKSRAKQNKFAFIFIAEQSNFGRAKVTKKAQYIFHA
jgi:hypothetical protein